MNRIEELEDYIKSCDRALKILDYIIVVGLLATLIALIIGE